jgi:hypothetical protein
MNTSTHHGTASRAAFPIPSGSEQSAHEALPRRRRNRRQAVQPQSILEVLQEKIYLGGAMQDLVASSLQAVRRLDPQLEFLEATKTIPHEVQAEAAGHRVRLRAYVEYVKEVEVGAANWTSVLRDTLHEVNRRMEEAVPDSSGQRQVGLDPSHATQIERAYEQMHVLAARGADFSSKMEDFLVGQQQSLGTTHELGRCYVRGQQDTDDNGAPESIKSLNFRSAYYASWDDQARLFQNGKPLHHNQHLRRFVFSDGSHVDIQAHVPALSNSSVSDMMVGVVGVATLTALAALGGLIGGPAGAVAMGGVGALLGPSTFATVRKQDATWQGYTASYYSAAGASSPWGVRHFYGWQKSTQALTQAAAHDSQNLSTFCNFADSPEVSTWWKWRSGKAEPRAAAFDGCGASRDIEDYHGDLHTMADQLVQALAAFDPSSSGTTDLPSRVDESQYVLVAKPLEPQH